jgi:hypothetical protein
VLNLHAVAELLCLNCMPTEVLHRSVLRSSGAVPSKARHGTTSSSCKRLRCLGAACALGASIALSHLGVSDRLQVSLVLS